MAGLGRTLIPDFPEDRPKVPEVRMKVQDFYRKPGNEVGGLLHVVLDDGNLELSHIEHAGVLAWEAGDVDAFEIACLLLQMTPTQRKKVQRSFQ